GECVRYGAAFRCRYRLGISRQSQFAKYSCLRRRAFCRISDNSGFHTEKPAKRSRNRAEGIPDEVEWTDGLLYCAFRKIFRRAPSGGVAGPFIVKQIPKRGGEGAFFKLAAAGDRGEPADAASRHSPADEISGIDQRSCCRTCGA